MGPLVVLVRRAAVVLILMAGYAYERIISGYLPLASIGLISFCAVANFAPGLVLGLYWRRAHRLGVLAGLGGGFVVWLYALLLPTLQQSAAAPFHDWLPAPLSGLDPVGQGFVVGIVVNTLLLVVVSLLVEARGADAEQAAAFVLGAEPEPARRAAADRCRAYLRAARAPGALHRPRTGRARAGRRTALARDGAGAHRARPVGDAGGRVGAGDHRGLRAAWPAVAEERPGADRRGIRGNPLQLRDPAQHARPCRHGHRRLRQARAAGDLQRPFRHPAGARSRALLRRPDAAQTHEVATIGGRVVELRLDPLPDGGFVATCNDVTNRVRTAEALHDSDRELRRAAETLEQRVVERTAELEASRAEAEAANLGKTRFIAAASHDLLQPLHAARLFTAAMIDRDPGNDLGGKIDASLGAVESLLDALLDISKLDAGAFKPETRPFALQPLFESLATAFAPVAARRDVELVVVPTKCFVSTDPAFLRRILQNLLPTRCATAGPRAADRACCWAAAAKAKACASRSRTTAPASPPTSRPSSSTNSCACRPRTIIRARSADWGWASPSSSASAACSTCRSGSPRRRPRLDLLGRGAVRARRRRRPDRGAGAAGDRVARGRQFRALHRQRGARARGHGDPAHRLGLRRGDSRPRRPRRWSA